MYRVSINKSTGKIIEMQSGGYEDEALRDARLATLTTNAVNAGYTADQFRVKWVTDAEYAALIAPTAEEIALAARITYITNRQGKRQLVAMGLYDQVKALIDAAGLTAQIDWDSASGFSRTDPTFLAVKQALNLTDEQEEQFFNEGSKL
jgi:hypothetical protein